MNVTIEGCDDSPKGRSMTCRLWHIRGNMLVVTDGDRQRILPADRAFVFDALLTEPLYLFPEVKFDLDGRVWLAWFDLDAEPERIEQFRACMSQRMTLLYPT